MGEAENGREGVAAADGLVPDVILMDLLMPEMDGLEAIGAIKQAQPEVEIVAVTSFIEEDKVTAALEAGATGYLLKDAEAEEVAQAVRAALRRRGPPRSGRRAPAGPADARSARTPSRSSRSPSARRRSCRWLGQGASNKEIATGCSSPSGRRART